MNKFPKIDLKGSFKKSNKNEVEKLKKKRINLIPLETVKSEKRKKNSLYTITVAIAVVGLLTGAYIGLDNEIKRMEKANKEISKRISELEEIKNQQDFIVIIDEKIGEKKEVLKEIEKSNISLMAFFTILEKNLPKNIGFINFSSDEEGNITINGSASSETSIAELIYNLKSEKMFSEIFVSNISTQGEEGSKAYTFSLVCGFGKEK